MWINTLKLGLVGTCILALGACGTTHTASTADTIPVTTTSTTSSVTGYGVVQSIDVVPRERSGLGLGTVAGAVVGGVVGSQIGSGSGRTAATVAGAAGGALVGREMEKNAQGADQVYRIILRMDNGAMQTLIQDTRPDLQLGEKVRVSEGSIVERMR